jgi:tRNA(Ile)-lysidine synthase TilS/MesJ/rhodanese-related sulfurtransferase
MLESITLTELNNLDKSGVQLIDIRGMESAEYGLIPGAVNIPKEQILRDMMLTESCDMTIRGIHLDRTKKQVLYCTRGVDSPEAAEAMRERGYDAYYLEGGYHNWLVNSVVQEEQSIDLKERQEQIEQSIRKKFHKQLFTPFAKAINTYELLQPGDHVAVCISGGKDSMLMAKLFQELKRHDKFPFELTFLVMDPGYSEVNRQLIEANARLLGIPIRVFGSEIFDSVYTIEKSPCYLCARMRRGYLYSNAKELGCNKIALGHHYDDVIETILMGMLYGGQVQTMMPKLHSTNFPGMELIRPMYLIREENVKWWRDYNKLHFLQCACRFTEISKNQNENDPHYSKRQEIKQLIAEMKKVNPFVEGNIFKSVENVNLNTVVGYKQDGVRHFFTEGY